MFANIKNTENLYRINIHSEDETKAQYARTKETMDYILSKIRSKPQFIKSMKVFGIDEDEIEFVINDYDFFMELCEYLYTKE